MIVEIDEPMFGHPTRRVLAVVTRLTKTTYPFTSTEAETWSEDVAVLSVSMTQLREYTSDGNNAVHQDED